MKSPVLFALAALGLSLVIPLSKAEDLPALASTALSGDAKAVASLRSAGQPGLDALLESARPVVTALRKGTLRLDNPQAAPLRQAVDAVARQRDAYASGLYWYTDLEAAKAQAKKTGRPILSLRLLGNLDEEYCCANSRFFRTVLYANAEVSALLRERYVLHWKSVRPAPLLTIDMGDGRRIKRTITGNSIHYILNADGQVLDALPGIYSPTGFLAALERTTGTAVTASREALRKWHGQEAHELCSEWLTDAVWAGAWGDKAAETFRQGGEAQQTLLRELWPVAFPHTSRSGKSQGAEVAVSPELSAKTSRFLKRPSKTPVSRNAIDALIAGGTGGRIEHVKEFPYPTEFDPPKGMVERPVMKKALPGGTANQALDPASVSEQTAAAAQNRNLSLTDRMSQALWEKMAQDYVGSVTLDEASRRFMMAKMSVELLLPSEITYGEADSENTPFARTLKRFTEAIARDMLRNEYLNHARIHQWLEEDSEGTLSSNVEELNRKVYQDIFLTPDYDAWLGLVPEDTYTALEKDGCACDKGAPPMRNTKIAR